MIGDYLWRHLTFFMRNYTKFSFLLPETSILFCNFGPQMRSELSVLIPTYNGDCRRQVAELCRQASTIEGLRYEIIVADDGSTDTSQVALCREIAKWPYCRFIERKTNEGRASIRNFLAQQAQYEWLLFMDCDMTVKPGLLLNYLSCDEEAEVVDGGVSIGQGEADNLRYLYEKACEASHTAEQRQQQPFQHFHTANFMVKREVMGRFPFDERYRNYGYEDVFFGKQLAKNRVRILHINNPAGFDTFEANEQFVAKTEEGLRTLHTFRQELRGYSRMLTFVSGIHLGCIRWLIRCWHQLFGPMERRNLCSQHPKLSIFTLYKIGYYLTLTKND